MPHGWGQGFAANHRPLAENLTGISSRVGDFEGELNQGHQGDGRFRKKGDPGFGQVPDPETVPFLGADAKRDIGGRGPGMGATFRSVGGQFPGRDEEPRGGSV